MTLWCIFEAKDKVEFKVKVVVEIKIKVKVKVKGSYPKRLHPYPKPDKAWIWVTVGETYGRKDYDAKPEGLEWPNLLTREKELVLKLYN